MLRRWLIGLGVSYLVIAAVRFAAHLVVGLALYLVVSALVLIGGFVFERHGYRPRLERARGRWQDTGERFVDPVSGCLIAMHYTPRRASATTWRPAPPTAPPQSTSGAGAPGPVPEMGPRHVRGAERMTRQPWRNLTDTAIIRCILAMAQALGLRVVAKGRRAVKPWRCCAPGAATRHRATISAVHCRRPSWSSGSRRAFPSGSAPDSATGSCGSIPSARRRRNPRGSSILQSAGVIDEQEGFDNGVRMAYIVQA